MSEGWIKIHRRMLKNPVVMKDSDHLALWVFLLLNASHVVHNSIFDGKKIKLKPGELISGRSKIALALDVSESKVERILKLFKSELMIRQRSSTKSRLISIINWESYQISEQQSEQQPDNKRTTSGQQANTIQEYKELKNGKNGEEYSAFRKKIFTDGRYYEGIRINWRVTDDQLNRMLDDFELSAVARGKDHKDYAAYREHFHNWGASRFTEYLAPITKTPMVH
jgi:hypothetical protein